MSLKSMYKSSYIYTIESIHKLISVHMGLISAKMVRLLLCPIPLRKGRTPSVGVFLCLGETLDLSSLTSLDTFENIVLLEGPDIIGNYSPRLLSSVSLCHNWSWGFWLSMSGLLGT